MIDCGAFQGHRKKLEEKIEIGNFMLQILEFTILFKSG